MAVIFDTGHTSVIISITASTSQSQGNGVLTADVNQISTVANANDVVTLPSAIPGRECQVINSGANDLQIFPASGDDLGAGANNSTSLEPGEIATFVSFDVTTWVIPAITQLSLQLG